MFDTILAENTRNRDILPQSWSMYHSGMRIKLKALKVLLGILATTLFFCNSALATQGIELNGVVLKVESKGTDAKPKFLINLLLQFKNTTDKPIIIIAPGNPIFRETSNVVFVDPLSENLNSSEVEGIRPQQEVPARPVWKGWREPSPLDNLISDLALNRLTEWTFVIVPPKSYIERNFEATTTNGFRTRTEPAARPNQNPVEFADAEYSGLKIVFRVSLNGTPKGVDILEQARKRWQKIGDVYFDDDGDYSIRSSVIPLLLP